MSMQYDVKSAQLATSEQVSGRVRIKGILISAGSGAVIDLKNGSGGNTVFGSNPVTAGNVYVAIPGEGILCENGIYANTVTNADITVFYG